MAGIGDTEDEVREGLLCPICFKDLGTINQLQEHFENLHNNEDSDVIHSLKEFFGKAKRKILKQDQWSNGVGKPYEEQELARKKGSPFQTDYLETLEIGAVRRHTPNFKKVRDLRSDYYATETNKLIIRLDRLITDMPTDPDKRKAHEKYVVSWISDKDVPLCPGCASSFNLSRRRHHCRLCGGVMCQNCSHFLDFSYARKLIHPTGSPLVHSPPPPTSLTRRGSANSLLSLVNSSGDPHIRVCQDCKALLDRRDQQVDLRSLKPIIVQMYERMRGFMVETEKLVPLYSKTAESLNSGETNYSLRDAQELRLNLTKLAENIDMISRKIATLGSQDEPAPSPRQLQLQGGVRMAVSHFMHEHMLGLPSLPDEIRLEELQKVRQDEVQRRIQQEKQDALEAYRREESPATPQKSVSSAQPLEPAVSTDTGWTPDMESLPIDSQDPMIQQINIIRNYIRQARDAHKYDEVQMLKANLEELQAEYYRQMNNKES